MSCFSTHPKALSSSNRWTPLDSSSVQNWASDPGMSVLGKCSTSEAQLQTFLIFNWEVRGPSPFYCQSGIEARRSEKNYSFTVWHPFPPPSILVYKFMQGAWPGRSELGEKWVTASPSKHCFIWCLEGTRLCERWDGGGWSEQSGLSDDARTELCYSHASPVLPCDPCTPDYLNEIVHFGKCRKWKARQYRLLPHFFHTGFAVAKLRRLE